MKCNELREWEPGRLSFSLRLTHDVLPTPVNLMRWKISENDKSKCGRNGTLRHIRYTWRHNQVLRVCKKYLDEKIVDINKGNLPTTKLRKEIDFNEEGQKGDVIASNTSKVENQ